MQPATADGAGSDGAGPPGRRVAVGGFETFVAERGEGPPVLLVHGSSIAVDAELTWFRLAAPLAARGRRVIAYDQPGFGRSEVPADRRYLDRLARARHAQALVERLDLADLTVVGHSEGGFIATRLALDNPDRVRRLVVVTSGGTSPRLGDERDAAWAAASARAYDYPGRAVDEDRFVATEGHLRYRRDAEFEARLRLNYRAALASGNAECFLRDARTRTGYGDYTALQERWILPFLPTMTTPALLVWAGRDETVPVERGLALARLMPRAELHVFPHAGHWVMHEEPERFNALIDSWIP